MEHNRPQLQKKTNYSFTHIHTGPDLGYSFCTKLIKIKIKIEINVLKSVRIIYIDNTEGTEKAIPFEFIKCVSEFRKQW